MWLSHEDVFDGIVVGFCRKKFKKKLKRTQNLIFISVVHNKGRTDEQNLYFQKHFLSYLSFDNWLYHCVFRVNISLISRVNDKTWFCLSFLANVSIFYPLKISKIFWMFGFLRGHKMGSLVTNRLIWKPIHENTNMFYIHQKY